MKPTFAGPHGVHRTAVAAAFLGQGLVFISLTTKLPDLQRHFDLNPGTFSILMLGLVLCAGIGSLVGERLAPVRGSAFALRLGFALMAAMVPVLAVAPSVPVVALAMAGYGLALGLVDAGTNMQGVALEHAYQRPIMPTFHGSWTLGGILGTLVSLATHNLSFTTSTIGLVVVPIALVFAPFFPSARSEAVTPIGDPGSAAGKRVPWRRILLVGAAMVLFYMADTAVTTWGPTYLDKEFLAGSALVSVATLPYLAASLLARTAGDSLAHRFGAPPLIRAAALLGVIGMAIVVFSPNAVTVMLGFLVLGCGLATIAPLSYSAAASIARESVSAHDDAAQRAAVDAIIARFNQFNYVGALLGAVMTGAVGNDSLRWGFAVPMVLIVCVLPLAAAFRS